MKTLPFKKKKIIEICSWEDNWQVNIASGNGLAPKRYQAISWTNDDKMLQCDILSFSQNELTNKSLSEIRT